MNVYFITFRSVTYAQRGERLLQYEGYRCTVQRTPRWMEEQGCGYCIRLWASSVQRPVEILRQNGLPLRKVYLQRRDGRLEEV